MRHDKYDVLYTSPDTLVDQAHKTAVSLLQESINSVDKIYGKGKLPREIHAQLVSTIVSASSSDFLAAQIRFAGCIIGSEIDNLISAVKGTSGGQHD